MTLTVFRYILAVTAAVLFVSCSDASTGATGMPEDFTHTTIDGQTVSLSDFKGQVVLVEFWATWCGPCKAHTPALKELWTKYRSQNFQFIAVSLDYNVDSWRNYVSANELDWIHVGEGRHFNDPVAKLFNVRSTPTFVLFDKNGVRHGESFSFFELSAEIDELLR